MTEKEKELEAVKSSKVFKHIFIDKEGKSYEFKAFNSGEYLQILIDGNTVFPAKRIMNWNPVEHRINIGDVSNLVIDYKFIDEGYIILWSGSVYKKLIIKNTINNLI